MLARTVNRKIKAVCIKIVIGRNARTVQKDNQWVVKHVYRMIVKMTDVVLVKIVCHLILLANSVEFWVVLLISDASFVRIVKYCLCRQFQDLILTHMFVFYVHKVFVMLLINVRNVNNAKIWNVTNVQ